MNSIFSTAFTRCPIVNLTKTAAFIASAVNWSYSYKVDVTQCAFAATIRKTALKNLASRGVFCFYPPPYFAIPSLLLLPVHYAERMSACVIKLTDLLCAS